MKKTVTKYILILLVVLSPFAFADLAKHFYDLVVDNNLDVENNFTVDGTAQIEGNISSVGGTGVKLTEALTLDEEATPSNPSANTLKLYFKNDGNLYKLDENGTETRVGGVGGSGGINLLADSNFNFEAQDPPVSWTASGGGTFAAESTNPIFDSQSGDWDASAASENLDSALIAIPEGLQGQRCEAEIYYRYPSGANGDIDFTVVDQTPSVIATTEIELTSSGDTKRAFLYFDCPSIGDSLRIRLSSTVNSGALEIDNAFLGTGKNILQISQSSLIALANYQSTANCAWTVTNASFTTFPADSDCPGITVNSSNVAVDTTDDDLPTLVFSEPFSPGKYIVKAKLTANSSVSGQVAGYRIIEANSNIANPGGQLAHCGFQAASTDTANVTCYFAFTLTSATSFNPEFILQGFSLSGSVSILANNDDTNFIWEVIKYPLSDSEAINYETTGFMVDANLGGANVSLSNSTVATYTDISNSGLDLVINKNKNGGSVQVPCNGGNASTGLTCSSGDEEIGIVFDAPHVGDYKACVSFSHFVRYSNAATSSINSVFELNETGNTSTTVLQRGKVRLTSGGSNESSANADDTNANVICGYFNFSSVGQKTLRLMYTQASTGSGAALNQILADRNAGANGDRDIHFFVTSLSQNFPTPVFNDLNTSLDQRVRGQVADDKLCHGRVTNAGTPALSTNASDCVQSLTDNGVGSTILTFSASYFSGTPNCVCSAEAATFNRVCAVVSISSTSVDIRTHDVSGTAQDVNFQFMCAGTE